MPFGTVPLSQGGLFPPSTLPCSDMPVILSLEDHCNRNQQLKMATYFEEIFGDMLLKVLYICIKVSNNLSGLLETKSNEERSANAITKPTEEEDFA